MSQMARTVLLSTAVATATSLLAGCGAVSLLPGLGGLGAKPEAASSARTPTPEPSPDVPRAPKVSDPVDTAKVHADPCSALTSEQLDGFELEHQGRSRDAATGRECSWDFADDSGRINFLSGNPQDYPKGLTNVYWAADQLVVFEPMEIGGHPAVRAEKAENEAGGRCQIYIGTSDTTVISVFTQISRGPHKATACDFAKQFIGEALATVKAQS